MRRPPFLAALMALVLCLGPAPMASAMSGEGLFATRPMLAPVAVMRIDTNSGRTLWLCQRLRQTRVLALPVWRSVSGYALAEGGCSGPRFIAMQDDELAAAQRAGLIPAEVPDRPRLSPGQMIAGHWGWAVLLVFGMAARSLSRMLRLRRRDRLARL